MKKIIFLAFVFLSALAKADDLILLSSDEVSSTFLDASSVKRISSQQVQFQIKQIYRSQRDMMGLQHNAASTKYTVACQSGLIHSRQKFLLNEDEIVWTFPASNKKQKAKLELSDEVLEKICPPVLTPQSQSMLGRDEKIIHANSSPAFRDKR